MVLARHRLVLAWPATGDDEQLNSRVRAGLHESNVADEVTRSLLGGGVLRGVDDTVLASLDLPVGVVPSQPDNPTHQRRTVDALLTMVPDAVELPGSPEPPSPTFTEAADEWCAALAAWLQS